MPNLRILVVDDEPLARKRLGRLLRSEGCEVPEELCPMKKLALAKETLRVLDEAQREASPPRVSHPLRHPRDRRTPHSARLPDLPLKHFEVTTDANDFLVVDAGKGMGASARII